MMSWFVHHAPQIALLGFFIGYVGIVLWTYAPFNKEKLSRHARIPFKE